ncbi:unnamed protein product, partial [Mesorhabditis belari]|uniref:Tc1-like transposase DDE domain-containing protein n=1 Tax=Mesorhabditis belari TaxID=2138241 RepID=A0AAF3FSY4_9BILA
MVWAGVTADGKTPLVFVQPGVKIDQNYYEKEILMRHMKPWADNHFSGAPWIFQQDSAPAHRAKKTMEWFAKQNAKVSSAPHANLDDLKATLIKEWAKIPVETLRAAVDDMPKRLRACMKEKGGNFEI